jgi:hypothetical protein
MASATAFGVTFIFVIAFQCHPVSFHWENWDMPPHGHCINRMAMGWSISSINFAIDLWLLLLPMPQLWTLRVPLRKKLGVCLMFAVGLL